MFGTFVPHRGQSQMLGNDSFELSKVSPLPFSKGQIFGNATKKEDPPHTHKIGIQYTFNLISMGSNLGIFMGSYSLIKGIAPAHGVRLYYWRLSLEKS